MRITIKRPDVAERSGTSGDGKKWAMREQQGYAYTVDKNGIPDEYPSKVSIRIEADQKAYLPGEYVLAPQSFYVGQYGKLTLGNLVLVEAPKTMAKAA